MAPKTMAAVLLTGHGGLEMLDYREDVPVPEPGTGEVLIAVAAAGVNNTDINTRIAWYSKAVRSDTGAGGADGFAAALDDDASWSGEPLSFPRIQGADVAGRIVAVGAGVDGARVGERVLVATVQDRSAERGPFACISFGSECDGGFAQYAVARSEHTYAVDSTWTDVELASIPCAYSTAENLLHRAGVAAGQQVLVTGASGGVGSAAVQLAKRRGARVVAVAAAAKAAAVSDLGAASVVPRGADLLQVPGPESCHVVVDLVAGPDWPALLEVLVRGGRYATAGAIAGPMVELDVRTLYLRDLTLMGGTWQPPEMFRNLVGYIERGEIRPVVARTYDLRDIRQAQEDFLAKTFTGKLVLVPPPA